MRKQFNTRQAELYKMRVPRAEVDILYMLYEKMGPRTDSDAIYRTFSTNFLVAVTHRSDYAQFTGLLKHRIEAAIAMASETDNEAE